MKKKPILVIMAAGMGSRYGGLKQIDPLNEDGDLIIDFSIYDAIYAGFKKVIFIIKKENEADFREKIGDRIKSHIEVEYVYQRLENLPDGYTVPGERVKPWGTGHAILSCIDAINGPFAVINADDYYGRNAFELIYDFLKNTDEAGAVHHTMIGYLLENTLTDFGHVARGVCDTDADGMLLDINERTRIEKREGGAAYTPDDGLSWVPLDSDTTVSMNMWGFDRRILEELKERFISFLDTEAQTNPLKSEYFLPTVVGQLIEEQKADVKVLKSTDRWYGVTYKEDKPTVTAAIAEMKEAGKYPKKLWV